MSSAALPTIPKIIHQIWVGDQSKCPRKHMQTWIDKHPGWQHILWTEANCPRLRCQKQFDDMKELNGKADILRWEILYEYGGIYIDADSICLNTLDDFFLANDSFCSWENEYVRTGLMSPGTIGAIPKNDLIKRIVDTIAGMDTAIFTQRKAWETVGPLLLTQIVRQSVYNRLMIYPSHFFLPYHYTGLQYPGRAKCYAYQLWGSTEVSKFFTYDRVNAVQITPG